MMQKYIALGMIALFLISLRWCWFTGADSAGTVNTGADPTGDDSTGADPFGDDSTGSLWGW